MNNKVIKDALFGAVGGVAGTFVIGKVMGLLSRFQSDRDKWIERELVREPPTEALVSHASHRLGIDVTKERKQQLGKVVNWGYGITWGAIYGVLRNQFPVTSSAAGLPFGAGFGLLGSAVLLPMLDLTPSAMEFPISSHLIGLASHYAYAVTVEGVCTTLEAADRAITSRQVPRRTNTELRRVS